MLTRTLHRLMDAQDRWARPLGSWIDAWISPRLGQMQSLKGFLNGTWLGHPLHAAITDVPVGALTLMLILDLLGQDAAADIALGISILSMIAAAATGAADFTDTHGRSQMVSTVHATAMIVALLVLVASLVLRIAGGDARGFGVILGFAGYVVLIVGTYVGGEVVYALGNQVNRHAWRSGGSRSWQPLEVEDVPEGEPVQARLGSQMLVLVRQGESIHALHDKCAHAEGPLSEGTIVDGCIECPWHGSRFELKTGARQRGPALYDQPRYEVRRTDSGGWEARRTPYR
jgi:nitrite reductase/ring-hydroxylating ferredoxin subunit